MAVKRILIRQRSGHRPIFGSVPSGVPEDSLPARRGVPPQKARSGPDEAGGSQGFQGLYIISVAARLLEMHPQTLRKYERVGLVSPSRTLGMLRLYSEQDIARLRLIKHLVDDLHMNLAGVEFALHMVNRLLQVRDRIEALEEMDRVRETLGQELETLMELLDIALPKAKDGASLWEE